MSRRCLPAGDAIRYFILNTHGGVYMDMDVECFRPTDSFLRGYDLVLNVELGEGVTVTNAVMASAPNITYWQRVFAKMQVGIARPRCGMSQSLHQHNVSAMSGRSDDSRGSLLSPLAFALSYLP